MTTAPAFRCVAPLLRLPNADELTAARVRDTPRGVELHLRFGEERVVLCAKSWSAKVLARWKRKRPRRIDFTQLSVTSKQLTVAQVVRGTKRHGVAVEVFANWRGSGNDLGSALLDARAPLPARGALDGAWKVVASGEKPRAQSGVWLTGHDFSYESADHGANACQLRSPRARARAHVRRARSLVFGRRHGRRRRDVAPKLVMQLSAPSPFVLPCARTRRWRPCCSRSSCRS